MCRESGKHGSEGAVGKAFPLGKQLAGRLPYIWDGRFSESMKSLLSPVDSASIERC